MLGSAMLLVGYEAGYSVVVVQPLLRVEGPGRPYRR
jgi:hypothetical protein